MMLLLAACLNLMILLKAYDATVPNIHTPICATDWCGNLIPSCYLGRIHFNCDLTTMYYCSYSGAGVLGNQCPSNPNSS